MEASAVKAKSGKSSQFAGKDAKHDVRGSGPRREDGPLMEFAQIMARDGEGPSIEGLAGELASMSLSRRQSAVLSLQRIRGNNFVQRLAIQAKLKVGPAGDRYEREADRVADQVMRMTEAPNPVQRQEEEEEIQTKPLAASITPLVQRFISFITLPLQRQGQEEEIQTKLTPAGGSFETGSSFESRLSTTRGGGNPLPDTVRRKMERGFGADFSGVRVHTGSQAADLNRAVGAQAFTLGRDIYMGEGRYEPGTTKGRRLLAHELVHTIQQMGGQVESSLQRVPIDAVVTDTAHLHKANSSKVVDESKKGWTGPKLKEGNSLTVDPDVQDSSTNWLGAALGFGATATPNFIRKEKVGFLPQANELLGAVETIVDDASHLHPRSYQNKILEKIYIGPKFKKNDKVKISKLFAPDPRWWIAQTLDGKFKGYLRHGKVTSGGMVVSPAMLLKGSNPLPSEKYDGGSFNADQDLYQDKGLTTVSVGPAPTRAPINTPCAIVATEASTAYLVRLELGGWTMYRWVPQGAITKTGNKVITEDLSSKYRKETGSLFPKPPSKEDVLQGGIGDCYLLAALISIVAVSPLSIMNMMRDNRDGTVSVRLYTFSGTPHVYVEKHVKIEKSTVVNKSTKEDVYARGALWVKLIEKAYAAAGFTGTGAAPIAAKPSFGDIAGGFTDIAWEHLMGKPPAPRGIVGTGSGRIGPVASGLGFNRFPWSTQEQIDYDSILSGLAGSELGLLFDKEDAYAPLVSFKILGNTDQVDTWIAFVKANDVEAGVRDRALNKVGKVAPAGYGYEVRLEDFEGLFKDKGLDAVISRKIVQWLENYRIYPGKRGTGKYTDEQLKLFQKIRQDLKAGKYIMLGSRKTVGRKSTGTGHSGGEPTLKGLAGGHAYAVTGYKPDKDVLAAQELAYVTLRNPWGQYGRVYAPLSGGKLKVDEAKSEAKSPTGEHLSPGEFDLELNDVTKRFDQIQEM